VLVHLVILVSCVQEHGKVIKVLLEAGADPSAADSKERTPVDYATISEAVWPLFSGAPIRLVLIVRGLRL
jgi:hypothetical protein